MFYLDELIKDGRKFNIGERDWFFTYFDKYVKTEKEKIFNAYPDLLDSLTGDDDRQNIIKEYIKEVKERYVIKVNSLNLKLIERIEKIKDDDPKLQARFRAFFKFIVAEFYR